MILKQVQDMIQGDKKRLFTNLSILPREMFFLSYFTGASIQKGG